ncbi:MAG: protein kinase [Caldilineaceae bacterium]
MAKVTGRKLGKYELQERLGRGGMAEVYKAFQPGVERTVAIKVLHCHLVDSTDFVARFQREARAIGRLQHPNIVRVIDFDQEGDDYYMVMDYIAEETLSDYLKRNSPLPVAEALRIGIQLADALAHAHAQQMIHRDIKPTNIIFTDAEHTQVVLTDFGLAQLCDCADPRLTMSGALIGTPTYMSPEAVRGEGCDVRTDIYSLGVVLYEMLTGKPPYVADTPYRMMMKQANEPLPAPRTLNPALPAVVEELLLTALAKDPDQRYQSAAELTTALQQVQAALTVTDTARPAAAPAIAEPVAESTAATTPPAAQRKSSPNSSQVSRTSRATAVATPQAPRRADLMPPWLAAEPKPRPAAPAVKTPKSVAAPIAVAPVAAPWRLWLSLSIAAGSVLLVAVATTMLLINF